MKKTFSLLAFVLALTLLTTGCLGMSQMMQEPVDPDAPKRAEAFDIIDAASGTLLFSIYEEEAASQIANYLRADSTWTEVRFLPEGAQPFYRYILYQERDLPEEGEERGPIEWDEMAYVTTYSNMPYVTLALSPLSLEIFELQEDLPPFHFKIPEENADFLNDLSKYE